MITQQQAEEAGILNKTYKNTSSTIEFYYQQGKFGYKKEENIRWFSWEEATIESVLNYLQQFDFHPINYALHENPIINKIREMESRRQPHHV